MLLRKEDIKKGLRVGLRVKLTNPKPSYVISASNPAIGSKWECEGTVTVVTTNHIRVDWDNHHSNTYHFGTLSASENDVDVIVSIWDNIQ